VEGSNELARVEDTVSAAMLGAIGITTYKKAPYTLPEPLSINANPVPPTDPSG
jgi:hypothetical protein